MPLTIDTADDYKVWDRTISVRFGSVRKQPGDSADEDFIPVVKRRAIGTKDLIAANGAYTGADVSFFLPQKFFVTGMEPKPGDSVTELDGKIWTALEVRRNKHGNTWQLICRDLAIVHRLEDLIDIERRDVTYDATGSPVSLWPSGSPKGGKLLYNNLPCRVKPEEQAVLDERGIRGREEKYLIVVSRNLIGFDCKECRIIFTSGGLTKILDADRYFMAEQLGELPRIEARWKVQ